MYSIMDCSVLSVWWTCVCVICFTSDGMEVVATVSKEALDVFELREFLVILSAVILNTWRTNNKNSLSMTMTKKIKTAQIGFYHVVQQVAAEPFHHNILCDMKSSSCFSITNECVSAIMQPCRLITYNVMQCDSFHVLNIIVTQYTQGFLLCGWMNVVACKCSLTYSLS